MIDFFYINENNKKALSLYVTILHIIILNKILTTSITSIIAVIVLMMAIANPDISLAVNQTTLILQIMTQT